MTEIAVRWRERPFAPELHTHMAREGQTIAEIVASIQGLPRIFHERGVVVVGSDAVPKDMWHLVRPRVVNGTYASIHLGLRLHGGGGGAGGQSSTKSTIAIVASVALVIATAWIGGGGLVQLGFSQALFGAGKIGAALAAGALSAVGGLAIAGLTPPPSVDALTGTKDEIPEAQSQGQAALQGNVLSPGAPVPRVWGTHDVTPPLAGEPIRELIGNDEYIEAVCLLAGAHSIENVRFGDIPISAIPDIQYEVIEGRPGDPDVSLVQRYGRTFEPNTILTRFQVEATSQTDLLYQTSPETCIPQWHPIASRKEPDELWIILNFQQGITNLASSTTKRAVPMRIRFRRRGEVQWTNAPEIHWTSKSGTPFHKHIKLKWEKQPLVVPVAPTDEGPYLAYTTVPAQTLAPAMGGWQAAPYFNTGAGTLYSASTAATHTMRGISLERDGVTLHLDPDVFPKDFYEVQLIEGNIYSTASFTPSSYTYVGAVYDHFGYYLSGSTYRVFQTRDGMYDTCAIARIVSIKNSPIVTSKDFAIIAIKAKNKSLEPIKVLASGLVPDWNGAEWTGLTATSNPAPHFRAALASNLVVDPIPQDLLDNSNLVAWRQFCIDEDHTVNAVFQGKSTYDVANAISGCGRARLRMSELWGVVIDYDRSAESIVQTLSPRRMSNFQWEKAFVKIPSGFRVSFDDIDNNYEEREVIVLRPGAVDDGIYEKVRYDGIVTEEDAIARARFDLLQLTERMTFYRGTALIEHLAITRGSLVGLNDEVLELQFGYAYINRIVLDDMDPSLIVGLELDGTIPTPDGSAWTDVDDAWVDYDDAWTGQPLGVLIRQLDGTMLVKQIETGVDTESRIITFTTPFTDPGSSLLAPGCFVGSGYVGEETKRVIVLDVTPKDDFTAQITMVDEAPQIFA